MTRRSTQLCIIILSTLMMALVIVGCAPENTEQARGGMPDQTWQGNEPSAQPPQGAQDGRQRPSLEQMQQMREQAGAATGAEDLGLQGTQAT